MPLNFKIKNPVTDEQSASSILGSGSGGEVSEIEGSATEGGSTKTSGGINLTIKDKNSIGKDQPTFAYSSGSDTASTASALSSGYVSVDLGTYCEAGECSTVGYAVFCRSTPFVSDANGRIRATITSNDGASLYKPEEKQAAMHGRWFSQQQGLAGRAVAACFVVSDTPFTVTMTAFLNYNVPFNSPVNGQCQQASDGRYWCKLSTYGTLPAFLPSSNPYDPYSEELANNPLIIVDVQLEIDGAACTVVADFNANINHSKFPQTESALGIVPLEDYGHTIVDSYKYIVYRATTVSVPGFGNVPVPSIPQYPDLTIPTEISGVAVPYVRDWNLGQASIENGVKIKANMGHGQKYKITTYGEYSKVQGSPVSGILSFSIVTTPVLDLQAFPYEDDSFPPTSSSGVSSNNGIASIKRTNRYQPIGIPMLPEELMFFVYLWKPYYQGKFVNGVSGRRHVIDYANFWVKSEYV